MEKIKDDEGEAGQRGSVSSQPRPVKEELMSLFKDSPRNRTKSKMKRAVLGEVLRVPFFLVLVSSWSCRRWRLLCVFYNPSS